MIGNGEPVLFCTTLQFVPPLVQEHSMVSEDPPPLVVATVVRTIVLEMVRISVTRLVATADAPTPTLAAAAFLLSLKTARKFRPRISAFLQTWSGASSVGAAARSARSDGARALVFPLPKLPTTSLANACLRSWAAPRLTRKPCISCMRISRLRRCAAASSRRSERPIGACDRRRFYINTLSSRFTV